MPTPVPVTPVHLAHPTTLAPIHLPHPSIAAAHLPDHEPLPHHPTPLPHHPTPFAPAHLPLAAPVTPVPDILNQIPGLNTDQLTEADLLLADPATHTHPLGTHPLLPIHPGHDIPHSHPPYDQHPVIDVASGAVLSNPDENPHVEAHLHAGNDLAASLKLLVAAQVLLESYFTLSISVIPKACPIKLSA